MMVKRIRDGRICETWAMVDDVGFHEQITGRTVPDPSEVPIRRRVPPKMTPNLTPSSLDGGGNPRTLTC
jgi:hypothetical protein